METKSRSFKEKAKERLGFTFRYVSCECDVLDLRLNQY